MDTRTVSDLGEFPSVHTHTLRSPAELLPFATIPPRKCIGIKAIHRAQPGTTAFSTLCVLYMFALCSHH